MSRACLAQLDNIAPKYIWNGDLKFILLSAKGICRWEYTLLELEAESWLSLNSFPRLLERVHISLWLKWRLVTSKVSARPLIHIKLHPEYCKSKYLHHPGALLRLDTKAFKSFTVFTSRRPNWVQRPILWNIISMI